MRLSSVNRSLCMSGLFLATIANAQNCTGDASSELVQKFAPILMHPHDEPNLPANVDWFLSKTHLAFRNAQCPADDTDFGTATLSLLEDATRTSSCNGHIFRASGTRSADKSKTFLLTDVAELDKKGSKDPSDWVTYYHIYRNASQGCTIQYWSFYAFNTGWRLGPLDFGSHGGDWEMVEVSLNSSNDPLGLRMTGHRNMCSAAWGDVQLEDTHPVVYTEKGGHEVHTTRQEPAPWIRHPTWSGSIATFPNGASGLVGPLVDLGSRLHPKVNFLSYSGLWGAIGATSISSGYWGPAFNETGMPPSSFLSAWCDQINDPGEAEGEVKECYPGDMQ